MKDTPARPVPLTCGTCFHCKEGDVRPDLTRAYACQEGPPALVFQGTQQNPETGQVVANMGVMYTPITPIFPACDRHRPKTPAKLVDLFKG